MIGRNAAVLAVALLSLPGVAFAQTARPKLKSVSPVGGQRGKTIDVTFTGTWVGTTTALLTDHPGLAVESLTPEAPPAGAKNPEGKLVAKIRIAADAPPGRHALRLVTAAGPTDAGFLTVGLYPEAPEVEPNNAPDKAQAVAGPVTVVGRCDGGEDVDVFRVTLKKGETLVVEAAAGSLGSPLQPVLALRDQRGFEVATSAALRTPDAFFTFQAPADGDYLLTLRDLLFRGGGDYVYRLTLGALPWVTSVYPPGGSAGATVPVRFNGVNLGGGALGSIALPPDPSDDPVSLAAPVGGGLANQIAVDVAALPGTTESEPNGLPKTAQTVDVPIAIAGRIQSSVAGTEDRDHFRFTAKKGEVFAIEVVAGRLGSPLDPVVTILDANGGEIASADDSRGRDSALTFTAPSDGAFLVRVSDLTGKGGADYVYRLRIDRARPDFRLDFAPDAPAVPVGGRVAVLVTTERRFGFNDAIPLELTGLPAGVRVVGDARIPAGQGQTVLVLEADPAAKVGGLPMGLTGRATIGGAEIVRSARPIQESYAKNGDALVRNTAPTRFPAASVAAKGDFVVNASVERVQVAPGASVELTIKVQRAEGYAAKIPLVVMGLPGGVSGAAEVPEKADEVKLTLKAEGNAPLGEFRLVVVGRSLVEETRFSEFASAPITLVVAK